MPDVQRRCLLVSLGMSVAALMLRQPAFAAANYPDKNISFVIPDGPGGGFDLGSPERFPTGYPLNYVALPQFGVNKLLCDPRRVQGSSSGMQVALLDGSVRSVSPGISPTTWARAVVANDGLTLGSDW